MPSTQAQQAPPEGRETTIRTFLIADVRGYTHFTRERGDEAAAQIAGKLAMVATEGVEAFQGELVETRGDEILAVFASPRRALRAGVELQDAFTHEAALEPLLPLRVGIGLAVGEAVQVGGGFRGNALNMAARLCAQAEAGVVLASEELVALAGPIAGITYQPAAPVEVKGVDGPVRPVRVLLAEPAPEPSTQTGGAEPLPDLPVALDPRSPLAGREHELRVLRWFWRRARHGHGRAVFVQGPSGAGKTRLAAELAREARAEGAAVIHAACAGPADRAIAGIHDVAASERPTLLVADDLDAAGGTLLDTIGALVDSVRRRPVLVLGTLRTEDSPLVSSLLARADPAREARLAIEPTPTRRVRVRRTLAVAAAAVAIAVASGGAGALLLRGEDSEASATVLNERVLDAVVVANDRLSQALADGDSPTAIRRAAEDALESVVRAEGAAAVIPLPAEDERLRQILQLALVGHYSYARAVAVAARTRDPYQIGVIEGIARSAAAAYSTLRASLPGIRTPPTGDFAAARALRVLVKATLPPPPPPWGGGGCPTCAPSPPPPPSPPAAPPPSPLAPRVFAAELDRLAAALSAASLPAATGTRDPRSVSASALAHAEVRTRLALAEPPTRYRPAARLFVRWLDASLANVLGGPRSPSPQVAAAEATFRLELARARNAG